MGSLRDELTGVPTPRVSYTVLCPPGWAKIPPAALTEGPAVDAALATMKSAGRADLVLQLRSMLSQLRVAMRERGVFEVYVAPEREPGAPLPAVLAVSPFVLPQGVSWEVAVARMAKGGTPERAAGEVELHLVRRRSEYGDASATVLSEELTYLAPVPGGDGRRALILQYTVLSVADDNAVQLAKGLVITGEAIMSTFRWVEAA